MIEKKKMKNRLIQTEPIKKYDKKRRASFQNPVLSDIFYLQQTIGNMEVQRMIESSGIMTKLYVNQPRDIYEQEADKITHQIMKNNNPDILTNSPGLKIQKKAHSSRGTGLSSNIEKEIHALSGKGQPLGKNLRDYFQPRFGVDLDDVRIHTDSNADKLARAVRARAFTYGNNVVFGKGEYKPETHDGKKLVAHELVHTIQQSLGLHRSIQRFPIVEDTWDVQYDNDNIAHYTALNNRARLWNLAEYLYHDGTRHIDFQYEDGRTIVPGDLKVGETIIIKPRTFAQTKIEEAGLFSLDPEEYEKKLAELETRLRSTKNRSEAEIQFYLGKYRWFLSLYKGMVEINNFFEVNDAALQNLGEIYEKAKTMIQKLLRVRYDQFFDEKGMEADWLYLTYVWFNELSPTELGTWVGDTVYITEGTEAGQKYINDLKSRPHYLETIEKFKTEHPDINTIAGQLSVQHHISPVNSKKQFTFRADLSGTKYYNSVEWFLGSYTTTIYATQVNREKREVAIQAEVYNKSGWESATRLPPSVIEDLKKLSKILNPLITTFQATIIGKHIIYPLSNTPHEIAADLYLLQKLQELKDFLSAPVSLIPDEDRSEEGPGGTFRQYYTWDDIITY